MRFFCFVILTCATIMVAQVGAQDTASRIAVVPFKSPFNPDYGVFMADRIAFELYSHTHVPALGKDRFVLVETDTLSHDIQDQLLNIDSQVSPKLLEHLRQQIPANYLLTGSITSTGIHHLDVLLLDLSSGNVVWKGKVRDNPSWVWTHNREVGETPTREIINRLGFGESETGPLPLKAGCCPSRFLFSLCLQEDIRP